MRVLRLAGALLLFGAAALPLHAEKLTLNFAGHAGRVGGKIFEASTPDATIPLDFTTRNGPISGSIYLDWPDTPLPGEASGTSFVFDQPVTTTVRFAFTWTTGTADAGTTPFYYSAQVYFQDTSAGGATVCLPKMPPSSQIGPGVAVPVMYEFSCTWKQMFLCCPEYQEKYIHMGIILDFSTFGPQGFSGFFDGVYTMWRNTGEEVTKAEPGAITNDPAKAGTHVTVKITGKNFENGSTVSFGNGLTVHSATWKSSTEYEAEISVATGSTIAEGPRDIEITKPGGTKQKGTKLFYVSSLSPQIEVNQGVPIKCSSDRPCIADHDTWVRVRLPCNGSGCDGGKSAATGVLRIRKDGSAWPAAGVLRPEPSTAQVLPAGDEATAAVQRAGGDALNFRLAGDRMPPEGTYELEFAIDPGSPGNAAIESVDRSKLLFTKLEAQPFRKTSAKLRVVTLLSQSPIGQRRKPFDYSTALDMVRRVFPISRDGIELVHTTSTITWTESMAVLMQVRSFGACETSISGTPSIAVLFTDTSSDPGLSTCSEKDEETHEFTCWGNGIVVRWENRVAGQPHTPEATLAHELGHHMLLGDTYTATEGANLSTRNLPGGLCRNLGDGCPAEGGLVDLELGTVSVDLIEIDPTYRTFTKRDLMGNAARENRWIDLRSWNQLYDRFMNGTGGAIHAGRWLWIEGTVGWDSTVRFDRVDTSAGASFAPGTAAGEYSVDLLDASGNTLASGFFDAGYRAASSTTALSRAPFSLTLPMSDAVRKISVKKNGTEIGTRLFSANAPVVTVTAPNGGESVGAKTTVTWTASDADADPLLYDLLYSPDGTSWRTVATALTGTSYEWDTSTYAGSTAARVKVLASDGANSASDVSDAAFTLSPRAPEVAFLSPVDGSAYAVGVPVVLSAYGYDAEDGQLAGSALSYSSNLAGALGSGSSVSVSGLAAGEHVISVTARDASGATATATSRVTIYAQASTQSRVLPVVTSTKGNASAYFRTTMQLHNPGSSALAGRLVYHVAGTGGSDADPAIDYMLPPHQTWSLADVLPQLGLYGFGSADVVATWGTPPVSVVRMFNDAGAAGTTGMTEGLFRSDEALKAGDTAVLIAPGNAEQTRFNIGIRTLSEGVSMTVTVRSLTGDVVSTQQLGYGGTYFFQQAAADLLGVPVPAGGSVSFRIDGGSAVIYGASTDNTTNDPSAQFARPQSFYATGGARILPVVASLTGDANSLFRTAVQLHNGSPSTITGRLLFHPAGRPASDSDPSLSYLLAAGQTTTWPDILLAMGQTGFGTLEIVPASGSSAPVSVARIYNDAGVKGTTGMTEEQLTVADAIAAGRSCVLLLPPDFGRSRFNVGIRTFASGAVLSVTLRSADGQVTHTATLNYPENYLQQLRADQFLGVQPNASDSIEIKVDSGSAIVYGATTDNVTQDPSAQFPKAIE